MALEKFKTALVVYRPHSKEAFGLAQKLAFGLNEHHIKVFTHPKRPISLKKNKPFCFLKPSQKVDVAIVLGGDGTYLEACRLLDYRNTPVLGINVGSLGFLTEISIDEDFCFDKLFSKGFETSKRTLLQVVVKEKTRTIFKREALNDIVIERGARSRLLNLEIQYDKQFLGDVRADGLIVATPTGSTAYNLAAGGPILHPEVQAFVLNPICPHSLTFRPMLLPDDKRLEIKLHSKALRMRASLTLDGQKALNLSSDHKLFITKALRQHLALKPEDFHYFRSLSKKLKFSE